MSDRVGNGSRTLGENFDTFSQTPRITMKRKPDNKRFFFTDKAASIPVHQKMARLNTPDKGITNRKRVDAVKPILVSHNNGHRAVKAAPHQFKDKVHLVTNTKEFLKISSRIQPQPHNVQQQYHQRQKHSHNMLAHKVSSTSSIASASPSKDSLDELQTSNILFAGGSHSSVSTGRRYGIGSPSPSILSPSFNVLHSSSIRHKGSLTKKSFTFDFDTPRGDANTQVTQSANSTDILGGGISSQPQIQIQSIRRVNSGLTNKRISSLKVQHFPLSRTSSRESISSLSSSGSSEMLASQMYSNDVLGPPVTNRRAALHDLPSVPHFQERLCESAPTEQKPDVKTITSGGATTSHNVAVNKSSSIFAAASPTTTTCGSNMAKPKSQLSRLANVASMTLRAGISTRIKHQYMPSLNKALIGKTTPSSICGPNGSKSRKKPRNLYLDCTAVEQEEGIAPPMSCRPNMSVRSTSTCSQISRGVYIGGASVAKDHTQLVQRGITHVVNCVVSQCPCYHKPNLKYLAFSMRDNGSEDISKYIYAVLAFVEDAHRNGGSVLIHCMRGISRSGSLAIAWVIHKKQLTLDAALRHCKARRPAIGPNATFMFQLSDWALHRPSVLSQKATYVYRVEAAPLISSTSSASMKNSISSPRRPVHVLMPSSSNESTNSEQTTSIDVAAASAIHNRVTVSNLQHSGDISEDDVSRTMRNDNAISLQASVGSGVVALVCSGNSCGEFAPLLIGPLSHFSARMFSSATASENNYVVVADGVLFLWQPCAGGRPSSAQAVQAATVAATDPSNKHGQLLPGESNATATAHFNKVQHSPRASHASENVTLNESQRYSRSRLILEAAVELLVRFEDCGNRTVQWVEDGAEPPEFWSSFAQIPQRSGVRLTPVLQKRKVLPALQRIEQLN